MADVLQPYSVAEFNKIPDLYHANTAFLDKDGEKFVRDVFCPLVLKHGLEDYLGAGMLHRHFPLKESEKLVEFNNISMPWSHQGSDDSHSGGMILPRAWLLKDDKLMPYEFFFSPPNKKKSLDLNKEESLDLTKEKSLDLTKEKSLDLTEVASLDLNEEKPLNLNEKRVVAFLDEFVKAAKCSDLDRVVALRLFPGGGYQGGLEFTEDRANIILKPGQVSHILHHRHELLFLFFSPHLPCVN